MPRTPSPTKRRRLDGAGDNNNDDKEARNDVTPRAISLSTKPSSFSSNANNEPFSAREHVSVSRTSSPSIRSSQSSRSSPTKQDLAMRFARDLPIHYRSIPSAPQRVQALAEQLADLESKQGILPGRLRATLQAYHSPGEPIKNYMFDDRHNSNSTGGKELDTYVRTLDRELEHLKEIRDNTQECNSRGRVFHEVEWNETVHSPMLRLATKRFKELTCRNLTQANLSNRWTNPELKDSRIDYGILVAPEPDSDLYHRILTYIQRRHDSTGTELGQVNPLIDIDIDRPIAVAVETKRLATGVEKANTQLAGFGRCMLRLQHDVTAFLADTESGSNNNSHAIVLPLLTVIGSAWEVDFMIREKGLAVIYGPVQLGSTQTLTNCYRLYRSLDILFRWAHLQCVEWWSTTLKTV